MYFPADFPGGMTYTVGQSRWATDWNYVLPSLPGTDGAYQPCTGTIAFDLAKAPAGDALASIYLACAGDDGGHVVVRVNGTDLATVPGVPLPSPTLSLTKLTGGTRGPAASAPPTPTTAASTSATTGRSRMNGSPFRRSCSAPAETPSRLRRPPGAWVLTHGGLPAAGTDGPRAARTRRGRRVRREQSGPGPLVLGSRAQRVTPCSGRRPPTRPWSKS